MKQLIWSILFLSMHLQSRSEVDSCRLRISLLTCSPGNILYTTFGHNALRIVDPKAGTDIVYNYGTFDFGEPGFYTNFIKGKLLYFLSQESYDGFVYGYALENRTVAEQTLNLTCTQKHRLQQFMFQNIREENKYYRYDFLYDNCTTRLRDLIEQFQDSSYQYGDIPQAKNMTFRNGLHYYLDRGDMLWSKFGIDLLLGSVIDKPMNPRESMFLPEFLETAVDGTKSNDVPLVVRKDYPAASHPQPTIFKPWSSPLLVFTCIALIVILLSLSVYPLALRMVRTFDTLFYFVTGLLGCLLLFMWLGTDHQQTTGNYNLLWAWPTDLFMAFYLRSSKKWVNGYLLLHFAITLLTLLAWKLLPQELNTALIPLLLLNLFRIWKINKRVAAHA